jgi:hypothetical protein
LSCVLAHLSFVGLFHSCHLLIDIMPDEMAKLHFREPRGAKRKGRAPCVVCACVSALLGARDAPIRYSRCRLRPRRAKARNPAQTRARGAGTQARTAGAKAMREEWACTGRPWLGGAARWRRWRRSRRKRSASSQSRALRRRTAGENPHASGECL